MLGGAGLGRGYLNRPELTAERFIANPFRPAREKTLSVGDLVRCLPTGTWSIGAVSTVRSRSGGFRIELEEIESVLRQHAAVREVVVSSRGEKPAEQRWSPMWFPSGRRLRSVT